MDQNRRILQDGAIAINQGRILDVDLTEKLKSKYEAKKLLIVAINVYCLD